MYMLRSFSCVQLFATLWIVDCQAPLSMGFSRQEKWSGLPCPPPGDLPDPGIEPASLGSLALAGRFFTPSTTWKALQDVGNEFKSKRKTEGYYSSTPRRSAGAGRTGGLIWDFVLWGCAWGLVGKTVWGLLF